MLFKSKLFETIWQRNKASIGFIYFLNIVEEICYVLIPSAVGMLINTFIYGTGYGLWAFVATYLGWQGIATLRKILDTIAFTKVYNQVSLETIEHHKLEGIEVSKINARIELLKQVVTFFEVDLPFMMNSIVSIFGAAILLYFYNPTLLFICLIIIIPSFIINYFFGKKMINATKNVNDQYEKQIDVITNEDLDGIKRYFEQVRRFNIRKSSLEAYNFGLLEIFAFLMIVVSIYVICKTPNVNYGDIVASYGIILRFAYGFDFIPHITERLATMRDIQNRLEEVYEE
jgi:ABC-type multidrug transport system fused ATPase/permease subunit